MRLLRKHTGGLKRDALPGKRKAGDYTHHSWCGYIFIGFSVLPLFGIAFAYLINHVVFSSTPSARQKYRFNWGEAMLQRSQLMTKYNLPKTFLDDISRKEEMSITEFRDLWDGKWPVIISDVVPSWGAYFWSKEFLYKFYSKENLIIIKGGHPQYVEGYTAPLGDFYKSLWEPTSETSWRYVSDEHFIDNHPQLLQDIGTSKYTAENFFDLLPPEIRPNSVMFLWGTKHSRSPLHIDPYNWTGTIAVIKGSKKWRLYPPGQDEVLGIRGQRSGFPLDCPHYVSKTDTWGRPTPENQQVLNLAYSLEFEQKAGELLIIPTGWAHQAYNTEETIALSSQYMNRQNYRYVLEEIIDCTHIEEKLPIIYPTLTPEEQVATVAKLIPPAILENARNLKFSIKKKLLKQQA